MDKKELLDSLAVSLGLNPLTEPFMFLKAQGGREVLYAKREATDQLRRIHNVSIEVVKTEVVNGTYLVHVKATELETGRIDFNIGAVYVEGLKGDALSSAYMKAMTRASRRATLSIVGCGITDESEVDAIPREEAQQVKVVQQSVQPATKEQIKELTGLAKELNYMESVQPELDNGIGKQRAKQMIERLKEIKSEQKEND